MNKQLMWISTLLPKEINNEIADKCLLANKDIGISERFFDFPLHISLKRTFYTDNFVDVKNDLKGLLIENGPLNINGLEVIKNKDMLWLEIVDSKELVEIHRKIDSLLNDKYQIPIDEFDKNYYPHVSLFRSEDMMKLDMMYQKIKNLKFDELMILDTFAMGTSLDNNEFLKLERK